MLTPLTQFATRLMTIAWVRMGRLHDEQKAATATEYVVLLVLVACAIIFIIAIFGERIDNLYQQAVDVLHRDVRL